MVSGRDRERYEGLVEVRFWKSITRTLEGEMRMRSGLLRTAPHSPEVGIRAGAQGLGDDVQAFGGHASTDSTFGARGDEQDRVLRPVGSNGERNTGVLTDVQHFVGLRPCAQHELAIAYRYQTGTTCV